jgi:hypothetical protein
MTGRCRLLAVCHECRLGTTVHNCTRDGGGPFEVGNQATKQRTSIKVAEGAGAEALS